MMKINANQIKTHFSMRTILILLLLPFGLPQAFVADDHIITIGGSVYAGGRSGAILEYKVKKNADGSEYLVNIVLNFSLQDILTASDPEVQTMAAMLAGMGITDMIVDSTTDVIYKKQS